MKIEIKVITKAKREQIKKQPNGSFKVYVTAAPEKGKANEAVVKVLADYFGVKKNRIRMIKGKKSRHKIFEISSHSERKK